MDNISDIKALQKWKKIPEDSRRKILSNVFCMKCGETTITDYIFKNDKYGLVLEGKCSKCSGKIARFLEDS